MYERTKICWELPDPPPFSSFPNQHRLLRSRGHRPEQVLLQRSRRSSVAWSRPSRSGLGSRESRDLRRLDFQDEEKHFFILFPSLKEHTAFSESPILQPTTAPWGRSRANAPPTVHLFSHTLHYPPFSPLHTTPTRSPGTWQHQRHRARHRERHPHGQWRQGLRTQRRSPQRR